ncbi:MAG: HIRAN domain-containing protein [Zoogloeaceae bacterium]|nr:HIRAN domain-containing protein [Zoogloeaceae bacterium]
MARMVIVCKPTYRPARAWGMLLTAWLAASGSTLAEPSIAVRIQQVPLAGFQFHAGKIVWEQLAEGDPLELVREPDNAHDARAVKVLWRGVALGHLPRSDNAPVAEAMDQGWRVWGRIGRLQPHPNPWRRVRIDVFAAPPQVAR